LIIGYLPLTLNNFILFTWPVTCANERYPLCR